MALRNNRKEKYKIMDSLEVYKNNKVTILGQIASPFTFNHQCFGEKFYVVEVLVKRLSESEDRIPVMVSERLIDVNRDCDGEYVEIKGQFRSYVSHKDNRNRLVLSVFAKEITFPTTVCDYPEINEICLDGYVCKPPVYRKTPLGREIADILLAVNRSYGKSDYIPCICWGRNARYAAEFEVGKHVVFYGRIQSREYLKKLDDDQVEYRTAYEVSVSKMEDCDEA